MKRAFNALLIVILAITASACAKDPLKQAGLQAEHTYGTVRDLNSSYERRDLDAFMEQVAPAYPDRDGLRKSVENVFLTYQTIRQKIYTNRMQLTIQEKGNIKAVFTWEGEWQTQGGKIVKDGARSTLILDKTSYKLIGIEGKNPYLVTEAPIPARQ
ncbi:MAG: hypothetical protein ACYC7L_10490 [Nitrospirota bacterium]